MAYCYALLTPKMAYEYLWNCTANLQGNTGHNIPCDNLVELLVQAVKKKIHAQGSNATYRSARDAALTLQIQEELMTNMQREVDKKKAGHKRPVPSKLNDIVAMVNELQSANIYEQIPGREFSQFPGFQDIYSRVKVNELHKWLSSNKQQLSFECI
jgi:NADH dehydrogenase/NADH:ubiquinone oxidoreductase subunit G